MRHPVLAACALAALAAPAVVAAQSEGPYVLPDAAPTPVPAVGVPVPEPRPGKAFVLQRVRGTVTYRIPGAPRSRRLVDTAQVPSGTKVKALHGRVRLVVAADRKGNRARGVFFDGHFEISQQARKPFVTTLTLVGGDFGACPDAATSRVAKDPKRKRVRRLWGDGHGRFRTRGRYSAATVRGTKWLVEDRCDGTLTRVARGEVDVEDFSVPEAAPLPQATPAPPTTGGGQEGQDQAPTAAPAPQRSKPRRVRVRKGGSYVARPG